MPVPNGYYPIYHPPHKIPGVFDLHKRGRFKDRPFVTRNWDYRVGFAGSATEAHRICDVMETVLRPLHQELAA